MADPKAFELLKQGVQFWNHNQNSVNRDLSNADLHGQNLSGARFEATNLACANLKGCDLSNAHLERADLTEAGFGSGDSGANLYKAQLREAKLKDCDLSGVKGGLQRQQLAGADLTGATLPAALAKSFDSLDVVNNISESARKLFITMLAACLYSWLTIATTADVNLITNRASSPLPIIQTSIPIVGFYVVVPLLLLCVYFYFHFYLQKLWEELGSLPAIFPDGRRLHERSDPWLLNDLVRAHVFWLKADRPFMSYFQQVISIILAWWLVPVTLLLFWGRYLPRHEFRWTTAQVALLAVSITAAVFLYRLAAATLRGGERKPFSRIRALRSFWSYGAVGTFLAIGAAFMVVSVGAIRGVPAPSYYGSGRSATGVTKRKSFGRWSWVPRAMDVVGYSPFANLSEADVSIKPLNWTGKSESELDLVKGAELGPVDLAYARAPGVFLARANLLFADLRGAILYSGDLRGASLLYAGLTGADLEHADLSGATLIFADLTDADLKSTNLTGAKLRWANLTRADLTTANLTGADLGGADLARADLVAANLTRASLAGAKLVGADLSNADLMFADFRPGVSSPFVMRIEKTVGLTAYALKTAKNWNKAYYDDELRQQLGLPPEYNQKLEDEQKREEQQKASPP